MPKKVHIHACAHVYGVIFLEASKISGFAAVAECSIKHPDLAYAHQQKCNEKTDVDLLLMQARVVSRLHINHLQASQEQKEVVPSVECQ